VETFKNPDSNRNEGIDLVVGNLAAYRCRKWDWELLKKELTVTKEAPPERREEPIPQPQVQRRSPFGRGWSV